MARLSKAIAHYTNLAIFFSIPYSQNVMRFVHTVYVSLIRTLVLAIEQIYRTQNFPSAFLVAPPY